MVLDARTRSQSLPLESGDLPQTYWVALFSSEVHPTLVDSASFSLERPAVGDNDKALMDRLQHEQAIHQHTQQHLAHVSKALTRSSRPFDRLFAAKAQSTDGATKIIKSPFAADGSRDIEGVLKASSEVANLYVDSRYAEELSSEHAQKLIRNFSEITLPRLRTMFGRESDVDGNGKINIFMSSKEKLGENIIGFFRPSDVLPSLGGAGNEQEIVYSRIPDAQQPFELFDATLAHETFHLINFAQKTLRTLVNTRGQSVIIEDIFLNEGLAHLAEELTGWGVCSAIVAKIYLDCLPLASLAASGIQDDSACSVQASNGDSLPRRGGMMLFLLYLLQQLGGVELDPEKANAMTGRGLGFLRELNQSDRFGLDNLETSSGRSFFSWYADFSATILLDSIPHDYSRRFFFAPETLDPATLFPRNLRMNTTRVDSSNFAVSLSGPRVDALEHPRLSDPLFNTGLRMYRFELGANQTKTLFLQSSDALGLGAVVIRRP